MKKINWQFVTIMVGLIGSLIFGSMQFAKLEERVKLQQATQCEKNLQFIRSMEELTNSIKCLTTTTDSLRYEIKFINFRNGLK